MSHVRTEDLMTVADAARLAHVSGPVLYERTKNGKMWSQKRGKSVMVRRDDVIEYMRGREHRKGAASVSDIVGPQESPKLTPAVEIMSPANHEMRREVTRHFAAHALEAVNAVNGDRGMVQGPEPAPEPEPHSEEQAPVPVLADAVTDDMRRNLERMASVTFPPTPATPEPKPELPAPAASNGRAPIAAHELSPTLMPTRDRLRHEVGAIRHQLDGVNAQIQKLEEQALLLMSREERLAKAIESLGEIEELLLTG